MSTTKSSQFQLVGEKGWKRGLGNLLQGEYSVWFKSSKWWKQLILWFSIINLIAFQYALRKPRMCGFRRAECLNSLGGLV